MIIFLLNTYNYFKLKSYLKNLLQQQIILWVVESLKNNNKMIKNLIELCQTSLFYKKVHHHKTGLMKVRLDGRLLELVMK